MPNDHSHSLSAGAAHEPTQCSSKRALEHAADLLGIVLIMATAIIAIPLFNGWSAI